MGNVETQSTLRDKGCNNPECTNPDCRNPPQLFIHSSCHDDGLFAVYDKATGCLVLICRECETPVVAFLVAAGGH
jgi:hypothetical protein